MVVGTLQNDRVAGCSCGPSHRRFGRSAAPTYDVQRGAIADFERRQGAGPPRTSDQTTVSPACSPSLGSQLDANLEEVFRQARRSA
jgi:hypothetical protein